MSSQPEEDAVPTHKACGADHLPGTPCPDPHADQAYAAAAEELAREMRALLKGRAEARRVARVQVADRLMELAQQLHDTELLTLVDGGVGQAYIAEELAVSQQAISYRVQHARKRQEGRALRRA